MLLKKKKNYSLNFLLYTSCFLFSKIENDSNFLYKVQELLKN